MWKGIEANIWSIILNTTTKSLRTNIIKALASASNGIIKKYLN